MRKPILIIAAFIALVATSCTKSTNNANYTCICNYTLITGTYSRDTTVSTTYASGTSTTDAQTNCTKQQNVLNSTGNSSAVCLLSK